MGKKPEIWKKALQQLQQYEARNPEIKKKDSMFGDIVCVCIIQPGDGDGIGNINLNRKYRSL